MINQIKHYPLFNSLLKCTKTKTIDEKERNEGKNLKKKRVRISDDTVLDMFRFLTRRELCSFKLVNRRMKRIVELGDRTNQLCQQFVLRSINLSVFPVINLDMH
jgi:hypothetical protein